MNADLPYVKRLLNMESPKQVRLILEFNIKCAQADLVYFEHLMAVEKLTGNISDV